MAEAAQSRPQARPAVNAANRLGERVPSCEAGSGTTRLVVFEIRTSFGESGSTIVFVSLLSFLLFCNALGPLCKPDTSFPKSLAAFLFILVCLVL